MGLNERQVQGLLHLKRTGRITNSQYQELTGVSKRQATNDLRNLEACGILTRRGTTGRGTSYALKGQQRGTRGIQAARNGRRTTAGE